MNPHPFSATFLKRSFSIALAIFSFAGITHTVFSQTINTYSVIAPNLSQVPVDVSVSNIPFTLKLTSGTSDSPQVKIRVKVTNKPEGASVDFKQQQPGGAFYNVIGSDYSPTGSFIIPAGQDRTGLYTIRFSMAGDYTLNYSLIDLNEANPVIVNQNVEVSVTGTPVVPDEYVPDGSGNATLDDSHPQVVIRSSTQPLTITVGTTTAPTINFGPLVTGGALQMPQTSIVSPLIRVSIPATSASSSDPSWNGVMNAPTITNAALADANGEVRTVIRAFDIGSDAAIHFENAVRIQMTDQAGNRVGFMHAGPFVEITSTCAADTQTSENDLLYDADCKMDVGTDLVVWTKHFTKFITFSATSSEPVTPPVEPPPSDTHSNATSTATTTIDVVQVTTTINNEDQSASNTPAVTETGTSSPSESPAPVIEEQAPSTPDVPPDTTGSEQVALLLATHPTFGMLASIIALMILFGSLIVLIKR